MTRHHALLPNALFSHLVLSQRTLAVLESSGMRASPSGKATASQAVIRGFESRCPLHERQGPAHARRAFFVPV